MMIIQDVISVSPDVVSGTPVFTGTRVPIKNLFDYLRGGESLEAFLDDFPSVHHDQAVDVLALALDALLAQSYAHST